MLLNMWKKALGKKRNRGKNGKRGLKKEMDSGKDVQRKIKLKSQIIMLANLEEFYNPYPQIKILKIACTLKVNKGNKSQI